jgi:predicted nucleic acid-binding Zn ribbon protein
VEVIRPSVSPGHRFCPSCGEELAGDPRFCASCGTDVRSVAAIAPPERRLESERTIGDSVLVAAPPSSRPSKPWSLIVPLIAAGLVIVLLAGWLFSTSGHLNDTRSALAAANSHITKLKGNVSSLSTQVSGLKSEKGNLQTQNSSLNSAMIDCKDAAVKARAVLNVVGAVFRGTASYYDYRATLAASNRSWSVCRTEASSNGAL